MIRWPTRLVLTGVVCTLPVLGAACGDDDSADRDQVVGALADQVAVVGSPGTELEFAL